MHLRAILVSALLLPLVGCVAQGDDPAAPAATADGAIADAPLATVTPVKLDGQSAPGGGVCVPVQCVYQSSPTSSTVFPVEVTGTIVAANLTLTWDAVSPATEQLILGIAYQGADGETWEYIAGPSPLTLAISGISIPAESAAIYVNAYTCQGSGAASACASGPSQAFSIEGDLESTA